VYGLPALEGDGDERYTDRSCDTCIGPDFDSAFDAGLYGKCSQPQKPVYEQRSREYQGSGYARISDQEIGVWSTRYSHECAHLLDKLAPILPPSSLLLAARSGA
jgi:hypothetical protein